MLEPRTRGAVVWLASVGLGLLIGAASLVGDAAGIRLVNGLANAAAPWLLAAFVSGALQRDVRLGAVAGSLSLLVGVASYYLGIGVVFGPERTYVGPLIVLWLGAAVAGGVVLGAAGTAWMRFGGQRRAIAGALPAAAFLAEAAHRLLQVISSGGFDLSGTYAQVMLVEAVAGLMILWLATPGPVWRAGVIAAIGLTGAGFAALVAVEQLGRLLAGR